MQPVRPPLGGPGFIPGNAKSNLRYAHFTTWGLWGSSTRNFHIKEWPSSHEGQRVEG